MVHPVRGGRFVASFLKRLWRTEVSNTVIGITTNQRTIHRCVEMLMESPTEIRAVLRERLTRQAYKPDRLCLRTRQVWFLSDSRQLNLRCL